MTQTVVKPKSLKPVRSVAVRPSVTWRLNTFQELMRGWKELGPYNAGQVMEISGEADTGRWKAAAQLVLTELGLGVPEFFDHGRSVRFVVSEDVPVFEARGSLQEHVSGELNRPFREGDLPVRFFVLAIEDIAGSGRVGHYFGVIYDHWIADSRAMRELMQRIFVEYEGGEGVGKAPGLTMENPDFQEMFRKYIGTFKRWAATRESLRNLRRHARTYRINLAEPLDFTSRMLYVRLPEGLIERVHGYAKAHHGSVNDGFLGVLGQAIGVYTAADRYRPRARRFHPNRDQIGLGTIVDIRDASKASLEHVFGLYLSSYTVALEKPEERELGGLVEEIGVRTREIKRNFMAVRAYAALTMARWWWNTFRKPRARALLFQKNVPVVAGISNVNMTGSWVDQKERGAEGELSGPVVRDYLRISPSGPLSPLVFTLTTIGKNLSLCVTYRTTAFTEKQATDLVEDFIRRLDEVGR